MRSRFLPASIIIMALFATDAAARAPRVTRSQVGAHIWSQKQGKKPLPRLFRQPLVYRFLAMARGAFKQRELRRIEATLNSAPITKLSESELGANLTLFRSEKARMLRDFNRQPEEVTEGFVEVDTSEVNGQRIGGRRIFYQRFRPHGRASGKVFVVSPGFQETGRSFYQQIDLLCQRGHDVIAMDHVWAGYTTDLDGRPTPGGFERGFAVARDVAAVAAFAKAIADRDHGHGDNLVLMGNSMGAGPGVLGAIFLSNAGQMNVRLRGQAEGVYLAGLEAPRSVHGLLQSPFLRSTPSTMNRIIGVLARIPGLNRLPFPAVGIPVLTRDAEAQSAFASRASRENVRVQLKAMVAAEQDMQHIFTLIDAGTTGSRFVIVHGSGDTLADAEASVYLADIFRRRGTPVDVLRPNTRDHVLEEHSTLKRAFLGMIGLLEN